MPKVSIISPVYNVEPYLKECIESLINQTLKDIEIIFVDDKSTDNSLNILKEYASKDSRILVLEQEKNAGPGVARNRALDIAKGKYIMFCDPDDWYELNACELAYNSISASDNDIGFFSLNRYIQETGQITDGKRLTYLSKYFGMESVNISECPEFYIKACFTVCQIYKQEFLNKHNIRYAATHDYEDHLFMLLACVYVKKMVFINEKLYNYRVRANSTTSSTLKGNTHNNLFMVSNLIIDEILKNKDQIDKNNITSFIKNKIPNVLYWWHASGEKNQHKEDFYNKMRDFYIRIEQNFGNLNLKEQINKKYYAEFKDIIKHPYWHRQVFFVFKRIFTVKRHDDGKTRIVWFLGKKFTFLSGWWINYNLIKKLWWIFPTKNSRTEFKKLCDKTQKELEYNKFMLKLPKIQANLVKKLSKKSRLKVLFLVNENSKWKAQSLYDLMAKSDRFEPVMALTLLDIVHKGIDITRNEIEYNFSFFKSKNMNVITAYEDNEFLDLNKFNADIIFYEQPWCIPGVQAPRNVCENSLICYVPYNVPNYGDKRLDTGLEFFKFLFRYYVLNDDYARLYKVWSNLKSIKPLGHTMLDQFVLNSNRNNKAKEKYVIYAPHYSMPHPLNPNSVNYGTFLEYGKIVLEYAKNHPEIKWVFKPHPQLKYALLKIFSENQVGDYYKEWEKIAKCCYDSSYIELFFDSRAMITDCASFLTEYFCTKKPIIHLIQEKRTVNPVPPFKKIIDTFYKVNNEEELMEYLDKIVLQEQDPKKEERLKALEDSGLLKGLAAQNIMDDLEKTIWSRN